MNIYRTRKFSLSGVLICLLVFLACNSRDDKGSTLANSPKELQQKAKRLIKEYLENEIENNGNSNDSIASREQARLAALL